MKRLIWLNSPKLLTLGLIDREYVYKQPQLNMKKYILFLAFIALIFTSCSNRYENNLGEMKRVFQRHIVQRDIDNQTQTTVELVRALSYTEIPLAERQDTSDVYLAKILLKSRWVYLNSSLVHNVNDTLDVYYDKDFKIVKVD